MFLTSTSESVQPTPAGSCTVTQNQLCRVLPPALLLDSQLCLGSVSKGQTSEDEALHSQQELLQHVWCSIHGTSLGSTADREKSQCPEDVLKLSSSSCWLIPVLGKTSREIFSYNFKSNVEVFLPLACEVLLKQNCSHNSINVCQSN